MNFMFTVGSGFTTTPPAGDSFSILQEQQIRSSPGAAPTGVLETVTSGSLLVCMVSYFSTNANGAITVSDDNGNTWVTNEEGASATNRVAIAYALNANSGNTEVTVTSSGTGDQYVTAVVVECAGMLTAGALDVDTSNNGTGTTASTGTTAETTQAAAVAFAVFGESVSDATQIPAGWVEIDLETSSATNQPISASYLELSSIGTQSASYTDAQLQAWSACIAVFKKAA